MIGKKKRTAEQRQDITRLEDALYHAEKDKQILNALCIDYTTAYCCDLLSDSITLVKQKSFSHSARHRSQLKDPNSYSEWIRYSYDHVVVKEASPDYLDVLDAQNLMKRLETEESVVYLHKTVPNAMGMEYFEATAVRLYVNDDTFQIILGYRPIDEIIVAERKHREELENALLEAQRANKAKSDFLANMSHDIRTPMNAIVGLTDLMAHETDASDKMYTYIEKVRMSSRHLLSLINDILDMSKIETGEVALNQDFISLAEQIGQVDSIVRSQTAERGQTFNIRVHTVAHEYLIGDGVRLRQILLNLLSNAVKYTPYGGTIHFDFAEIPCDEPDHAAYRISVEDNGCGMPPEFIEHIFEPFIRAENSVTNRVQGTGLGMAITKSIVDLMGGTITVQSEVDKGSRFEVTLTFPIDYNADMKTDLGAAVLISDDEVLRNNVAAAMREVNVRFFTARTKEEAAKLMETQKMDIVLVSGHLSDESLPERVAFVRRSAENAVLVFFVDYVDPAQVERVVSDCGIDGLIPRPFFLSNLLRSIERIKRTNIFVEERGSVLKGKRFLCAEDNELNAEILEAILDMHGASCVICPNGQELLNAFAAVQPGEYDAILMDVQMPVMNGLEATRAVRGGKNPLGRTIPIIAMTANAFAEDIQQCLDAGMNAHVSKPIDIDTLERTLKSVMDENTAGGGTLVFPKKT